MENEPKLENRTTNEVFVQSQIDNNKQIRVGDVIVLIFGFLFAIGLSLLQITTPTTFHSSSCESCGLAGLIAWGILAGISILCFLRANKKMPKLSILGIILAIVLPLILNVTIGHSIMMKRWNQNIVHILNDTDIEGQMNTLSQIVIEYYQKNNTYEGLGNDPRFIEMRGLFKSEGRSFVLKNESAFNYVAYVDLPDSAKTICIKPKYSAKLDSAEECQ